MVWKAIHDALKKAPTVVGWLLAFLAMIMPEKLAKWLLAYSDWITAPRLVFAAFLILLYMWAIWFSARRCRPNFDDVSEWSVSFDLGCWAYQGFEKERFALDMCRFVNLSSTQARVIDVELFFPSPDPATSKGVVLRHSRQPGDEETRFGVVGPRRYEPFLSLPIKLAPNECLEGRIEFEVPEGARLSETRMLATKARVTEARSHETVTIWQDEVYDAQRRKAYRGIIGAPYPRKAQHPNAVARRTRLWRTKLKRAFTGS